MQILYVAGQMKTDTLALAAFSQFADFVITITLLRRVEMVAVAGLDGVTSMKDVTIIFVRDQIKARGYGATNRFDRFGGYHPSSSHLPSLSLSLSRFFSLHRLLFDR